MGAIVGADNGMSYTKRVGNPKDIAIETERLRMQILKDHPGIREKGGQKWH